MQIGIIGLPYSGKTTFFQTVSEQEIDPVQLQKKDLFEAVIKVPDERLDYFTDVFNPKKKVNATLTIIDYSIMQKTEQQNSLFPTAFLSKIRLNEALILVVRGFNDESIPHIKDSINIFRDIQILEDELLFSDTFFVENRLEKIEKELMRQKVKDQLIKEKEIMIKWQGYLQDSKPLSDFEHNEEEIKLIKNYQMLTAKPLLIAVNLDESDIEKSEQIISEVRSKIIRQNVRIEPFFAKIEMELMQLAPEEKLELMAEYGLKESALHRLIRSAYDVLGVQSFFTVGEDECRAWTIKKGMTAQEAAGTIHTDFFNKFIRAEVVGYKDFVDCGSFPKCKEKGVFRLEGKEYIPKDGDILHIRHS